MLSVDRHVLDVPVLIRAQASVFDRYNVNLHCPVSIALDSYRVRGAQWAGQLGDGRAINLGAARGADGQLWELQLKVCWAQSVSNIAWVQRLAG